MLNNPSKTPRKLADLILFDPTLAVAANKYEQLTPENSINPLTPIASVSPNMQLQIMNKLSLNSKKQDNHYFDVNKIHTPRFTGDPSKTFKF